MSTPSVEASDPPTQDHTTVETPRKVIRRWGTTADGMRLEDTGDGSAVIVRAAAGVPITLGDIRYIPAIGEHEISWNRDGKAAYSMHERNSWDDEFYYAMEQWQRGRS